jgi:hypothetical protein
MVMRRYLGAFECSAESRDSQKIACNNLLGHISSSQASRLRGPAERGRNWGTEKCNQGTDSYYHVTFLNPI